MSTTPLFGKAKHAAEALNAWASEDCPGATYEDLLEIAEDGSPGGLFAAAKTKISKVVGVMADGRPIKASLDEAGFEGNRLPVYVAALGGV